MPGEWIEIEADDGGRFGAYMARPESSPAAGIVVLQEIFGVNEAIRSVADSFSHEGYVTLAPDLFWRIEPRIELGYETDEIERARAYGAQLDVDRAIQDIGAAVAALRAHEDTTDDIAVLGFCLGGRLAYLSAARLDVAAAVSFYGTSIHDCIDEASNVTCPIQFHFGEEDGRVPIATVAPIRDAFAGRRDVEFHVYSGAGHGFYNAYRGDFREEAAALAHDRTLTFLQQNLDR